LESRYSQLTSSTISLMPSSNTDRHVPHKS
jgi:hypothetical protein